MRQSASTFTTLLAAAALSSPVGAQQLPELPESLEKASCVVHTTILENTGFGQGNVSRFYAVAHVDSTEYRVPVKDLDVNLDALSLSFPDSVVEHRTAPLLAANISFLPDSTARVSYTGNHAPFRERVRLDMQALPRRSFFGRLHTETRERIESHEELWESITTHRVGSWYALPCTQTYLLQKNPRRPHVAVEFLGNGF